MKRIRNTMSRYDYADDRKVFRYWVKAPGPCARPYWRLDLASNNLYLEQGEGVKRYQYCLRASDLDFCRHGWRWEVARALRETRRALRANT